MAKTTLVSGNSHPYFPILPSEPDYMRAIGNEIECIDSERARLELKLERREETINDLRNRISELDGQSLGTYSSLEGELRSAKQSLGTARRDIFNLERSRGKLLFSVAALALLVVAGPLAVYKGMKSKPVEKTAVEVRDGIVEYKPDTLGNAVYRYRIDPEKGLVPSK